MIMSVPSAVLKRIPEAFHLTLPYSTLRLNLGSFETLDYNWCSLTLTSTLYHRLICYSNNAGLNFCGI